MADSRSITFPAIPLWANGHIFHARHGHALSREMKRVNTILEKSDKYPLTEKGKKNVEMDAQQFLSGVDWKKFDKVRFISSEFCRCQQTATIYTNTAYQFAMDHMLPSTKFTFIMDKRLNEIQLDEELFNTRIRQQFDEDLINTHIQQVRMCGDSMMTLVAALKGSFFNDFDATSCFDGINGKITHESLRSIVTRVRSLLVETVENMDARTLYVFVTHAHINTVLENLSLGQHPMTDLGYIPNSSIVPLKFRPIYFQHMLFPTVYHENKVLGFLSDDVAKEFITCTAEKHEVTLNSIVHDKCGHVTTSITRRRAIRPLQNKDEISYIVHDSLACGYIGNFENYGNLGDDMCTMVIGLNDAYTKKLASEKVPYDSSICEGVGQITIHSAGKGWTYTEPAVLVVAKRSAVGDVLYAAGMNSQQRVTVVYGEISVTYETFNATQ